MTKPLMLGYRANTSNKTRGNRQPIEGSASARLLDQVYPTWQKDFETRNLLWSTDDTADPLTRAIRYINELRPSVIVAFGRDVMTALGLGKAPMFSVQDLPDWIAPRQQHRPKVVCIPHPSPRNRVWNDVANRKRAGDMLASATKTAAKSAA